MPILTILLDTNEFIFGLREPEGYSAKLLGKLIQFNIKLPRFVIDELHNNLPENVLKLFYSLLKENEIEILDVQIPASLVEKYKSQLPPEDAIIAAYCEFLHVDVLISENRHFLVNFHPKVFQVLSVHEFMDKWG